MTTESHSLVTNFSIYDRIICLCHFLNFELEVRGLGEVSMLQPSLYFLGKGCRMGHKNILPSTLQHPHPSPAFCGRIVWGKCHLIIYTAIKIAGTLSFIETQNIRKVQHIVTCPLSYTLSPIHFFLFPVTKEQYHETKIHVEVKAVVECLIILMQVLKTLHLASGNN